MSEPESSKETRQQRTIRLLTTIKNSKDLLSFSVQTNGWDDMYVLEELSKSEYIAGSILPQGSGLPAHLLLARILKKGEEYLEELESREQNRIALPLENEQLKQQIKDLIEADRTLLNYWKSADWGDRFGMVGVFLTIFGVGFLCAKTGALSRLIDLIISVKP
jgi:hypothetical protein